MFEWLLNHELCLFLLLGYLVVVVAVFFHLLKMVHEEIQELKVYPLYPSDVIFGYVAGSVSVFLLALYLGLFIAGDIIWHEIRLRKSRCY